MIDTKSKAYLLEGTIYAPNVLHFIKLRNHEDRFSYAAFLNSSILHLIVELFGRSYGGGVLKIEVYELKKMPVIDMNCINASEKQELRNAFLKLANTINKSIKAEETLESLRSKKKDQPGILEIEARKQLEEAIEAEKKAQKELDEAVYDILGLTEKERRQVEEGLKELQELRRARTKS